MKRDGDKEDAGGMVEWQGVKGRRAGKGKKDEER